MLVQLFTFFVVLWAALFCSFFYLDKVSKVAKILSIIAVPFVFMPLTNYFSWIWFPPIMNLWLVAGYSILIIGGLFTIKS